ncbi:nucleotidyltransferase domain-containing protein [Caldicoprobacter faecalis]|uniref:Nucleotidyltransferase domain-containing protein n=1 Tax=Caldicoprobacter faecalis TaxID=937334 RepID=A0A1I5WL75_9FIRM|nr:nucleotidyltransferase domain-containing protein [Caldicoprobacter faecalis]SFQ20116.1 Nucleotidyltransferase domain-containing protein [Caldicoprobacter faecalis]
MIKFGKKLPKDILVKVVEKLPAVFEKDPQIVAAYIYGSYATGKTTDLSDIDIAVLLRKKGDWKKQLELMDSIAEALETEDFDLLWINFCN